MPEITASEVSVTTLSDAAGSLSPRRDRPGASGYLFSS